MTRIDELLKKMREMPEEEQRQLAKDHLRRYTERLERKRSQKVL